MRLLRWLLLAALVASISSAHADGTSVAPAPIQSTNAIQTCGTNSAPVATLNGAGSTAFLNCPGAGSYDVRIVPTAGSPLVGALTSNDLDVASAPSSRTLYKNGVGALEVATDTLTGGTASLTYRTCGGNNLTIGLSSYTSGSAAVYITASYTATIVCLQGSVDSRADRAVRNGKAYSAFAAGTVTAGQYISLYLNNPLPAAGAAGSRVVFSNRQVACNNPTATAAPQGYALTGSIANPTTVNTPTTAAIIAKRGGNNAGTPTAQAFMTVSAANPPDNTTSVPIATRPTFFAPTGGIRGGPESTPKILDPGQSMTISVQAIGTGLTGNANPVCIIDMVWEEEPVN